MGEAIQELGPYRLDVLLGRGGMGEVYRAWDRRLERWVAIKRLLKTDDAVARARFLREARAAARLGHPGILQVFDILEVDGTDWIVMEMVDGPDLATLLKDGPLDVGLALDYGRQIAGALAAAHAQGIVHRDLKTENVMVLSSGHTKVLDFGLAKRLDLGNGDGASALSQTSTMLSQAGRIVGTPRAMSPEQAEGHELDFRSDLFALGVLLYELLSARSPFHGRTVQATLLRILIHRQPPLRDFDPQIPETLSELVDQLLEKEAVHRPAGATEVADALAGIAAGNPLYKPSRSEEGLAEARTVISGAFPEELLEEAVVRTLLCSGLAESTRRAGEIDKHAAADLRSRHQRLARELLSKHEGSEIHEIDVNFAGLERESGLLLFERPWNAVRYAVAYHAALRDLSAATSIEIGSRVGIHLGEVILRRHSKEDIARGAKPVDVEGLAKPTAVRLMSLAAAGQTLLTRAACDVARRSATGEEDGELTWLEHGSYHFEGVADDVDVFEVGVNGEAPLTAPQSSGKVQRAGHRSALRGDRAPLTSSPVVLKTWPSPELPEHPYPVLLPYTHPELMAGREEELEELRLRLQMPVSILGVGAPSGTGKSSLLLGGLLPTLRSKGCPVALVRHPEEPGIAGRLLGDLLEGIEEDVADEDWRGFVERLAEVEHLTGEAPLLVLDQIENVLRDDAVEARARLGLLLAATAERRPGIDAPACRWLFAYRNEVHGKVLAWLRDVLLAAKATADPQAEIGALPHDLSGLERFQSLTLQPVATPAPASDALADATRVFQMAIEKPLTIPAPDGTRRYGWRFAPGHAERLARTFAEARLARPEAPLVPELQVVLAHLLTQASDGVIIVPTDPEKLVEEALADHLRRALEATFPTGITDSAIRRARALLALRQLATATGQRRTATSDEGVEAEELARAIGGDGEEILEQLATPLTRLVVLQDTAGGLRYVLSHDRMAEVVVQMVEDEGRRGKLLVDTELLRLRRFVALKTTLFHSQASSTDQERRQQSEVATRIPRRHFRSIAAHAEALLWDEDRRAWWAACQRRRKADLRRATVRTAVAWLVLVFVVWVTWSRVKKARQHAALLEQVSQAEPGEALAAFDRLADQGTEAHELLTLLKQRDPAMDVLERGIGGVPEVERGAAVLQAVEVALPWVAEAPEDPVLIANLVWALDYAPARDPSSAERARALRDEVLAQLRELRPPPPLPDVGDPDWVEVPAGTFLMGSPAGEGSDDEQPQHEVTLPAFRILRHEVTNGEYRRLWPEHGDQRSEPAGEENLPATSVSWYEAYTYAAWLGGRLPTEAEWEYAARAGCRYSYCNRDGLETPVDTVAWTLRNSRVAETRGSASRPVMRLEPNPWGLYDMFGNVWEWTADWYGEYPGIVEGTPWGPTADLDGGRRVNRGGGFRSLADRTRVARRVKNAPDNQISVQGFRVVLLADH